MSNNSDRCSQLRALHAHLSNQVKLLKEDLQKAQREGIVTSAETLNTVKRLQSSLQNIQLELQKCPPENKETVTPAATKSMVHPPNPLSPTRWFSENEEHDAIADDEDF